MPRVEPTFRTTSLATLALALTGCAASPAAPPDLAAPVDAAPPADLHVGTHEDLAEAEPTDMAHLQGPARLSETGLYSDIAAHAVAPGAIAFTPRYELWSDGADKSRWLLLPPGAKIDTADMDNWRFPVGTKVWKEFRKGGKRLETRLLEKVLDGPSGWYEIAYAWNEAETEAFAAPVGLDDPRGESHWVPTQDECDRCHSGVADVVIGVSALQWSAPKGAAPDGGSPLDRLAAAGRLSAPPPGDYEPPGAGVVKDALGYLHGNCGHCHRDGAPQADKVLLRLALRVTDATPDDTGFYNTTFKVKAKHTLPNGIRILVTPGKPDESQLFLRAGMRDFWAMPPVCTRVVDTAGMDLLRRFITGLPQ